MKIVYVFIYQSGKILDYIGCQGECLEGLCFNGGIKIILDRKNVILDLYNEVLIRLN